MKILRIILIVLVAAAVIGLLCWQAFITKDLDSSNLIRGILILAGLVLALVRPKRRKVSNKKALYQKAYGEYVQNAFCDDPKLEKKLFDAIDDYNQNKPAAAVAKLSKLRKECQRTADIYAVTVFTALCCDDMKAYEEAVRHYQAALQIRPSSSLTSNMGLCFQRLGDKEKAMTAYERAVQLDSNNANAYNNISVLYFREGDYKSALEYAEAALDANPQMPQALSAAAICCALLGYQEEYENYYRRAVTTGYDGKKIKEAIRALDPEI